MNPKILYIRVQTVDESVWPYPKEEGWTAVQPIDKGQSTRQTMVVPMECLVTPQQIAEKIVADLRSRGWRPP